MYIPFEKCIQLNKDRFQGVLHIGAHHGEEAESYAKNGVKKVIWVEACRDFMSELFDKTKHFSALMHQDYFNECLSDAEDEEITFNVANNQQSSSILELGTHAKMYPHITYSKQIQMKTKTFEQFLRKNPSVKFEDYDFINLDVQGAELKVLKGFNGLLNKENIKAIYTEINTEEVYKGCCLVEELDKYLSTFGFKRVLTAGECKQWGDALYLR